MTSVKTIKISGSLGRRFGVFHNLAVDSFPECIRALSYQVPGFKAFMSSEVGRSMKFAIFIDGKNASEHEISRFKCAREIRIIPVPSAAKNAALMQIVVGAVIMATAFITAGASLAAMTAFQASAFMAGGAMVLGGITQILSPQPGGFDRTSGVDNKPSYAFGGAINTKAAGYPVQLPYGYRTAGGALYASGAYAEDDN